MPALLYPFAAMLIGMCLSMQPPINAAMARTLGSPMLAATISIFISLVAMTALWLVADRGGGGNGAGGGLSQIRALPWWVFIGGLIGVVFVAGSLTVAPVTGVALFFVCVVAGQVIGAALIDQFGLFGQAVKPVSALRLGGIGLVLLGAYVVQRG